MTTQVLTTSQQALVDEAKAVSAILKDAGYKASRRAKIQTHSHKFIRYEDGDFAITANTADFTITVYKYSKTGQHLNPAKFLPLLQGLGFKMVQIDRKTKFQVLVAEKAGA